MINQLLSVPQLAEALQVPPKTIYQWVWKREIPHLKVGRHLRFNLVEVLAHFRSFTDDKRGGACIRGPRLLHPVPGRSLKISSVLSYSKKE